MKIEIDVEYDGGGIDFLYDCEWLLDIEDRKSWCGDRAKEVIIGTVYFTSFNSLTFLCPKHYKELIEKYKINNKKRKKEDSGKNRWNRMKRNGDI